MEENAEARASKRRETVRRNELLSKIAELGGKGMKEEDIVYQGQKLVLPERWKGSLDSAISYLKTKKAEEEEISTFTRTFNYRPWDGARNAFNAMKKAFGMVSGKPAGFFQVPPKYIQVPVSVTQTEEVPWGQFEVPLLENTQIWFGDGHSAEYGQVFAITINSPRKNRDVIEGLFILIEQECEQFSIYRGKAIDGQVQPQFLDLSGYDDEKVVYSEQVRNDLHAHLWGPLQYQQEGAALGLPTKRSVLLTGKYGTGKSLAGTKTAIVATENQWTFLMARPGRDDFAQVMQTARLYQPAVVFMEDVDTVARPDNKDQISRLLDVFDGIQVKNTKLMIVLTTNHPEELHQGMMRPGRLDAIVEINELDAAGIEKLIRQVVGKRLAKKVDFAPIVQACKGYLPAFLKETADRSVRYALVRQDGKVGDHSITTEDLVFAANGLRPQYDRMQDAPIFTKGDRLEEAFSDIIGDAVKPVTQKAVLELVPKDGYMSEECWDPTAVRTARVSTNGKK